MNVLVFIVVISHQLFSLCRVSVIVINRLFPVTDHKKWMTWLKYFNNIFTCVVEILFIRNFPRNVFIYVIKT